MRPEEAHAVANALLDALGGRPAIAQNQLNDVIKSHHFAWAEEGGYLTVKCTALSLYRVKETGRIVRLVAHIEDDRYLCVDDQDKSNPCYNLPDLEHVRDDPELIHADHIKPDIGFFEKPADEEP